MTLWIFLDNIIVWAPKYTSFEMYWHEKVALWNKDLPKKSYKSHIDVLCMVRIFMDQTLILVQFLKCSRRKNFKSFFFPVRFLLEFQKEFCQFCWNKNWTIKIYFQVHTYGMIMILFGFVTVSKAGVQRIPFIIRSKVTKRAWTMIIGGSTAHNISSDSHGLRITTTISPGYWYFDILPQLT